ncbi:MAG: hypothetical protein ACE5IW_01205 [bacterium]
MDKENFALESFKNTQELVRFLDQKAAAILVVYGFILTAFIEFSKGLSFVSLYQLSDFKVHFLSVLAFLSGLALITILLYQFYFIMFKVIKPRYAKYYSKKERSLFYFEHISKREKGKFFKEHEDLSENKILNEILGQVYEVSKITNEKTEQLSKTITFLYVSILVLLLFILFSRFV